MSKLLINEPPLQVLPSLALAIGLNGAIFIQQLHYQLLDAHVGSIRADGKKWVWYGYLEWRQQLPFWSQVTIYRTVRGLEQSGILKSEQVGQDRRKWYRIDYDHLEQSQSLKLRSSTPQIEGLNPSNRGIEPLNLRGGSPQIEGIQKGHLNESIKTPSKTPSKTPLNSSDEATKTKAEIEYLRQFDIKQFRTAAQYGRFQAAEALVGPETMLDVVAWAATAGISDVNRIYTAASKWRRNGHGNQPEKDTTHADTPAGNHVDRPKASAEAFELGRRRAEERMAKRQSNLSDGGAAKR